MLTRIGFGFQVAGDRRIQLSKDSILAFDPREVKELIRFLESLEKLGSVTQLIAELSIMK